MRGTGRSVVGVSSKLTVEEAVDVAFAGRTLHDNDGRERVSDVFSLSPHIIVGSEKNGQPGDHTRVSGMLPVMYPAGNVEESSTPTQSPDSEPHTDGQLLMTDRKKSKPKMDSTSVSSCVMVTVCLPGSRLVFDHSNCWLMAKFLLAVNRCGVELSIDTLKKPRFKPTAL